MKYNVIWGLSPGITTNAWGLLPWIGFVSLNYRPECYTQRLGAAETFILKYTLRMAFCVALYRTRPSSFGLTRDTPRELLATLILTATTVPRIRSLLDVIRSQKPRTGDNDRGQTRKSHSRRDRCHDCLCLKSQHSVNSMVLSTYSYLCVRYIRVCMLEIQILLESYMSCKYMS